MPRRDGLSPVPIHPIDALLVGSPDAVRVPLIGQALCAGFPSPADDFLEGALARAEPEPPTFLWRIRGSSMEGAGIHDRASRHCRTLRVRRRAGPDTVR